MEWRMKVVCKQAKLDKVKSDALIVGVLQNRSELNIVEKEYINSICKELFASRDFKGKSGEVALLYPHGVTSVERLLLVGLGEEEKYSLQVLREAIAATVDRLKSLELKKVTAVMDSFVTAKFEMGKAAQAITETFILGYYSYNQFKNPKGGAKEEIAQLSLICDSQENGKLIKEAVKRGKIIADSANFARDLQNHPGNWLTPKKLAELASKMAREAGMKCKILTKADMKELRLEALLGVAGGSKQPPRFIILEHNYEKQNLETIVFVGKGITFDSGGISIKPSDKMEEMKFDMSGAAAVLGAMKAAAELDLPFHVVGLIPAAENLPSATSIKPGDILTASSGTTIEVINTDAEGRLILADALAYAKKFEPKAVIDLATLTGACVIALGHHASGLMGNDQDLMDALKQAGEESGERVWQLPLWEEYYDDIKGDYADIKNSAGRAGGVITAAAFLGKFADSYPWAHLDIAGTAWTNQKKNHFGKGGTGVGVRLLVQFLRDRVDL